jgi:hypothetical protein
MLFEKNNLFYQEEELLKSIKSQFGDNFCLFVKEIM